MIDGAIRAPQPGAPFAYVTTKKFLEAFGFASLRDLPDLEQLKAEELLQTTEGDVDLDEALGFAAWRIQNWTPPRTPENTMRPLDAYSCQTRWFGPYLRLPTERAISIGLNPIAC